MFHGTPAELAARAPVGRYLVAIRDRDSLATPALASVQLAVGPSASIAGSAGDAGPA